MGEHEWQFRCNQLAKKSHNHGSSSCQHTRVCTACALHGHCRHIGCALRAHYVGVHGIPSCVGPSVSLHVCHHAHRLHFPVSSRVPPFAVGFSSIPLCVPSSAVGFFPICSCDQPPAVGFYPIYSCVPPCAIGVFPLYSCVPPCAVAVSPILPVCHHPQ